MAIKRQRPDGGEDDIDLDEQLLNLLPDELRDSDEIYLDDEEEPPRGKGGILAIMFGIFFGLLVAGVAAWYLLGGAGSNMADGPDGPPVITADSEPYKTRPEEPGGMMVENKDKLVYNRIAEGDGAVKPEETLLPDPEQPKAPPMPEEPSTVMAEPAAPEMPAPEMPASDQPRLSTGVSVIPPQSPPPSPVATDGMAPPPPPADSAKAVEEAPAAPEAVAPSTPETGATPPAPVEPAAVKPAPVAPAAPATPASVPAATGAKGDTLIQVAALRSEAAAEQAWRGIQQKNKDLLGGFPHQVVRADLKDKGIYFRLRVGPVGDRAQAKALCDSLKSRGQGCIVVR